MTKPGLPDTILLSTNFIEVLDGIISDVRIAMTWMDCESGIADEFAASTALSALVKWREAEVDYYKTVAQEIRT